MRSKIIFALGAIMLLAGVLVAARPLFGDGTPVTGSRLLDMAFAAFFLLRGMMNVRTARRGPRVLPSAGSPPDHRGTSR